MFKLRKLRAEKHFAIVDYNGPFPIESGHIIEYMGVYYECKYVIVHTRDRKPYDPKAVAASPEEIELSLPELIVESFPLI